MPKQVDRLLATAKEAANAAERIHRDAAQHGGGRWIDEKTAHRIRVSGTERLDRYLVGTGFPFKAHELLAEYLRQFERVLRRTAGIRRTGGAAIDLAYVANGILEGFWESRLAPWDYAAGVLLVAEAGGGGGAGGGGWYGGGGGVGAGGEFGGGVAAIAGGDSVVLQEPPRPAPRWPIPSSSTRVFSCPGLSVESNGRKVKNRTLPLAWQQRPLDLFKHTRSVRSA